MTDEAKIALAKNVLLPVEEIDMWREHLTKVHENRKKAAQA